MRNVVISTHINEAPGIAHQWTEFLKRRVDNLLVIQHPLREDLINHPLRHMRIGLALFSSKGQYLEQLFPKLRMPFAIAPLRDLAFSIYFTTKAARTLKCRWDLFIGIDCLNALAGIVLRKLGIVKRVIFYPVDYATNRFDDILENMAYQKLVQFATHNSDLIWSVSQRIAQHIQKFEVPDEKVIIVPHGYNPPPEKPAKASFLDPTYKKLVYVGNLEPESGLQLVLESLPEIVKRVPEVRFYIIGHGSRENIETLERLVKKHRLDRYVHYLGVMLNKDVLNFLLQCDVGMATFPPVRSRVHFVDMSMKAREYLACGLPVIATKVSGNGSIIKSKQAGIAINYDKDEVVEAVVRLLTDEKFYKKCKANTRSLVDGYTWDSITLGAWKKTLAFFNL